MTDPRIRLIEEYRDALIADFEKREDVVGDVHGMVAHRLDAILSTPTSIRELNDTCPTCLGTGTPTSESVSREDVEELGWLCMKCGWSGTDPHEWKDGRRWCPRCPYAVTQIKRDRSSASPDGYVSVGELSRQAAENRVLAEERGPTSGVRTIAAIIAEARAELLDSLIAKAGERDA